MKIRRQIINWPLFLLFGLIIILVSGCSSKQVSEKYIFAEGQFSEEEKAEAIKTYEKSLKSNPSSSLDIIDLDFDNDLGVLSFTLTLPPELNCADYWFKGGNIEVKFEVYNSEGNIVNTAQLIETRDYCSGSQHLFKGIKTDKELTKVNGGKLKIIIKSSDGKINLDKEYPFEKLGGEYKLDIQYAYSQIPDRRIYFNVQNVGNRAVPVIFANIYKGEVCEGDDITFAVMGFVEKPQPGETKEAIFRWDEGKNISEGEKYCIEFSWEDGKKNITFTT